MLKIRLARVGKKKKPAYRFIVSEAAKDPYGRALEILGHYDPFSKVIEVDKERILHWISKGAKVSPTAHNLLVDQNVIKGDKVVASKGKKKKKGEQEEKSEEAKPAEDGGEKVEEKKEENKEESSKEEKVEEVKPAEKKEEKNEEKPTEEKKEKIEK